MSATRDITQPGPAAEALGRFAEVSVALATSWDTAALRQHAERLSALTSSDLVLLYEARPGEDALELVAHSGLPDEARSRFDRLGASRTEGAGGRRAPDADATPLAYRPRTDDLEALGIRAYWAYPIWTADGLAGQVFFGSRQWDHFHKDTLSVFAATTLQVAAAFERRRAADAGDDPPTWSESGGRNAARKRQQFIAVLAHELRNPIAPIRSGLDLLAAGMLDEAARRDTLQMMQRQVAHLVRLIDDLLDTVRLDTGRLQVRRELVLLRDVVRSGIESIRPALAAKAQALRLDDDAADVVVDVDPVRLAQAFVNILSASVRRTPAGGTIAVAVARDREMLQIDFEDEGPGVEPDELHNVFELFPRSPMEKSDDGLGIGLALVKGLVELNAGTVEARPRDGGIGSAYTVLLPVAPVDVASLKKPPGASPALSWPSHRVLIVDDNRDAADTLGLLFEFDGHTVRLAHDGPTGVAEAREFQPEIILMDIGLPGFDGNEAVRRIRAQAGSVRPFIIALTGWGAQSDRDASKAAGCDRHVVKPVAHAVLQGLIRDALASGVAR